MERPIAEAGPSALTEQLHEHEESERGDSLEPPSKDKPRISRSFIGVLSCVLSTQRRRKARCDLGDVNAPKKPPCTRCRREGVECEFLPSRRGGRRPANKGKRKLDPSLVPPGGSHYYTPSELNQEDGVMQLDPGANKAAKAASDGTQAVLDPETARAREGKLPSLMGHIGFTGVEGESSLDALAEHGVIPPSGLGLEGVQPANSAHILPPLSTQEIFSHTTWQSGGSSDGASHRSTPTPGATGVSPSAHPKLPRIAEEGRRRPTLPLSSERLVGASLRTPADAVQFLAESPGSPKGKERDLPMSQPQIPRLEDFPLVANGVMTGEQLCMLISGYFSRNHFIYPVCANNHVPRTPEAVARFASEEVHLATVFCVVASRQHGDLGLHDKIWEYCQTLINAINTGKMAGVGAVEALLLLSEFLPRIPDTPPALLDGEENRLSWMLVGSACRLASSLGLDRKRPMPASTAGEEIIPPAQRVVREREWIAWTYCYMFDCQLSIRTGNAPWFKGFSWDLKVPPLITMAYVPQEAITRLLRLEIFVLAKSSTDDRHPGVRFAVLLKNLLRAFDNQGGHGGGDYSVSQTRATTPVLQQQQRRSPTKTMTNLLFEETPLGPSVLRQNTSEEDQDTVEPAPPPPFSAAGSPFINNDQVQQQQQQPFFVLNDVSSSQQLPPLLDGFGFGLAHPPAQAPLLVELDQLDLRVDFGGDVNWVPPDPSYSSAGHGEGQDDDPFSTLLDNQGIQFWDAFEPMEGEWDWMAVLRDQAVRRNCGSRF
ncbi:hypothetical protein T439DRAFT_328867 [Meredithblackwellia eburnea MCA 4105]